MNQPVRALTRGLLVLALAVFGPSLRPGGPRAAAQDDVGSVLRELNRSKSVVGSDDIKSYPVVFDAVLQAEPPPMEIGDSFNQTTIHPKMADWMRVSGWAESNPDLAKAILACESKTLFGLPYGAADVSSAYREAGLTALVGEDGSLRNVRFPYLRAIDMCAAFATAEAYRLLDAGRMEEGLHLQVAGIFLLRECCDREFLEEQIHAINLVNEGLSNLRDMFYTYQDQIPPDLFGEVSMKKLPFLRPDRGRLLMPEGDKIVSSALISEVFDDRGQPDKEKFAVAFSGIQSEEAPLTRFGAARRWRMIAEVHDSKEDSLERLTLVYDDWWRRWRVEEYDTILEVSTQFERTNPIRFAAVIYSMQDIENLFRVRNELLATAYGTAMAGGLCGYHRRYETYPSHSDKVYEQFARKRSDRDPFDMEFSTFKYRELDRRTPVDTPWGRVYIEPGECILYSLGMDHEDGRGSQHTDDGAEGDIVLWPPVKALAREQGLLE